MKPISREFWEYLFNRPKLTDEQEVQMGREASEIWENKAFNQALLDVRIAIHEKWASEGIDDAEGQRTLRLMLKLLDDIEGNIKRRISNGKLADIVIETRRKEAEKAKNVHLFRR